MQVFYSDPFSFPLPLEHRFPLAKYRLLRERVGQLPANSGAELVLSPRAQRDELLLVHDAAYVDDFAAGRLDKLAMQRIGFPWSPELVERTLRSTGATIAATRAALHDGGAIHLAGGTHHARRGQGAGYCVFNDCAVGARIAQQSGIERVLIVDTENHCVRRYDPVADTVTTVAGVPTEPGTTIAAGWASTHLDRPHGVAIAPDGRLVVVDSGNDRILAGAYE